MVASYTEGRKLGCGGCRKVEDAKSGSGSEGVFGVFTRLTNASLLARECGRHLILSQW